MKSYEWNKLTQSFNEVDDPIFDPTLNSMQDCLANAGYFQELSSNTEDGEGATVTIYATDNVSKPRFYIDLMGQNTGIATFIARDFLSLLDTLRQLHPILTLVGLDQFATSRISDRVVREIAKVDRHRVV